MAGSGTEMTDVVANSILQDNEYVRKVLPTWDKAFFQIFYTKQGQVCHGQAMSHQHLHKSKAN